MVGIELEILQKRERENAQYAKFAAKIAIGDTYEYYGHQLIDYCATYMVYISLFADREKISLKQFFISYSLFNSDFNVLSKVNMVFLV